MLIPPRRHPPVARRDRRRVNAIIVEAKEHVEYYPHECVGASVRLGYHPERAAIVTVQQSPSQAR